MQRNIHIKQIIYVKKQHCGDGNAFFWTKWQMRKDAACEIFVYITFQLFSEHNLVFQLQECINYHWGHHTASLCSVTASGTRFLQFLLLTILISFKSKSSTYPCAILSASVCSTDSPESLSPNHLQNLVAEICPFLAAGTTKTYQIFKCVIIQTI